MIWLFSIYLIVMLATYLFFIYEDIKSKELGAFDGFSYLMLAMAWPFLGLIILGHKIEDWFIIKMADKSECNS